MKDRKIVVAWDFSGFAKTALRYALENFEGYDIQVVCVLEQPNPYAFGINWEPAAEATSQKNCADDFYDELKDITKSHLPFVVLFGDPAPQIALFAEEQNADMIIMSTHGRTGFSRLMMGSVTQKVLGRVECPVLVLPGKFVNSPNEQHVANAS